MRKRQATKSTLPVDLATLFREVIDLRRKVAEEESKRSVLDRSRSEAQAPSNTASHEKN
jgi:hypothetical protein